MESNNYLTASQGSDLPSTVTPITGSKPNSNISYLYGDNQVTSLDAANHDTSNFTPNPSWNIDLSDFLPDQIMYIENIELVRQDWSEDSAFLPTTIIYSLAFVLGVLGNAIAIYVLLTDKKAHNVTNTFLVSLAIADLLFLLLVVPYEMAYKLAGYWTGVQVFCKLSAFIEMLTACASIWNLTAVGVERYIVIVHPLKTRTMCSLGKAKKIIIAVWCISILLSTPCLYVFGTTKNFYFNSHIYYISSSCTMIVEETPAVAWYQLLVMFLLPCAIMGFCYTKVILVLWISTRDLRKLTQSHNSHEDHTIRLSLTKRSQLVVQNRDQNLEIVEIRKQVIRMLLTIIVIFLICWGPKLVLNLLRKYQCKCLHNNASFYVMMTARLLPYIQSMLNPFIYIMMSKNFRQSMRKSFHRCCPLIKMPEYAGSHHYHTDILRMESYQSKTNTTAVPLK